MIWREARGADLQRVSAVTLVPGPCVTMENGVCI